MVRPLRISGLDGLNAAPLLWGLDADPARASLTLRSPAGSAAALAAGQADVALIPTIELQRSASLEVVPGICIAARRRVGSVLLLCRTEPSRLRSVAVDQTSRTSVALLRILLHHLHGVKPEFHPLPPHAGNMLAQHDGALLIADAALRSESSERDVLAFDLAEMWSGWTGLPFVFAVWAAPADGLQAEAIEFLVAARAAGLAALPLLVAGHATRDGNPGGPALTAYLGEFLHYTLGSAEEASLARFFGEAHALGLTPQNRPLAYLGESGARAQAAAGRG